MKFYKYHGAGNDFLLADNREGLYKKLKTKDIVDICHRHLGVGADGLILLEKSRKANFRMKFYNCDGSTGMMCGNGARCLVAFAQDLGFTEFTFEASDGIHTAQIYSKQEDKFKDIAISIKDVNNIKLRKDNTLFVNTGTNHFVKFVNNIDDYPVVEEGEEIRYSKEFKPVGGTNVDFIEFNNGFLYIRTYEKGVEDETYACGTGIVAATIAAYLKGENVVWEKEMVTFLVRTIFDVFLVKFLPQNNADGTVSIHDIVLRGPVQKVCEVEI